MSARSVVATPMLCLRTSILTMGVNILTSRRRARAPLPMTWPSASSLTPSLPAHSAVRGVLHHATSKEGHESDACPCVQSIGEHALYAEWRLRMYIGPRVCSPAKLDGELALHTQGGRHELQVLNGGLDSSVGP